LYSPLEFPTLHTSTLGQIWSEPLK
jgi:hypothetical protein